MLTRSIGGFEGFEPSTDSRPGSKANLGKGKDQHLTLAMCRRVDEITLRDRA